MTDTTVANRPLPSTPALQRTVQHGDLIKQGAHGAAVKDAQLLLQAHGFSVGPHGADGVLGNDTARALRAFQTKRGIAHDTTIGPETLRELRTPTAGVDARKGVERGTVPKATERIPGMSGEELRRRAQVDAGKRTAGGGGGEPVITPVNDTPEQAARSVKEGLAPRSMNEREKYNHYAAIVKQNGGTLDPNKPTVLALRGQDINGNRHATTSARKFDDTFVVLTPDKRVVELKGSTHSGQVTSSLVPHVGRINEGNYRVSGSEGLKYGKPQFRVTTQGGNHNIAAVRDLNNDGKFSPSEIDAAKRRGTTQDGILFHTGTNDSPHSIGCFTMPPAVYDRFVNAVGKRGFNFSLVSAN